MKNERYEFEKPARDEEKRRIQFGINPSRDCVEEVWGFSAFGIFVIA